MSDDLLGNLRNGRVGEFVLTWWPAAGEPVEVPFDEPCVFNKQDGCFKLSTRDVFDHESDVGPPGEVMSRDL